VGAFEIGHSAQMPVGMPTALIESEREGEVQHARASASGRPSASAAAEALEESAHPALRWVMPCMIVDGTSSMRGLRMSPSAAVAPESACPLGNSIVIQGWAAEATRSEPVKRPCRPQEAAGRWPKVRVFIPVPAIVVEGRAGRGMHAFRVAGDVLRLQHVVVADADRRGRKVVARGQLSASMS